MTTQWIPTDKTLRYLEDAIHALHRGTWPALRYRQEIILRSPHADPSYAACVIDDRDNQILTIGFPIALRGMVGRFWNSHGVRMVTYVRNARTGFIREKPIEPGLAFWLQGEGEGEGEEEGEEEERPVVRVYTQGIEDLVVRFDVLLLRTVPRGKGKGKAKGIAKL